MIWFVDFLAGFALMVVGCTAFIRAAIAATWLGRWLGWEFRRGSLAREAQGVLARDRVRRQIS